jgi:hypothetical protein
LINEAGVAHRTGRAPSSCRPSWLGKGSAGILNDDHEQGRLVGLFPGYHAWDKILRHRKV